MNAAQQGALRGLLEGIKSLADAALVALATLEQEKLPEPELPTAPRIRYMGDKGNPVTKQEG